MASDRVVLDLTLDEVEILLRWSERATRPLYATGNRYLSEAEADLLAKLEAAKPAGDEAQT